MRERLDNGENNNVRYDLDPTEAAALVRELLDAHPPAVKAGIECYELSSDSHFSNIGRHIEASVFGDTFGNSSEQMVREYGPYEDQSRFFITVDSEKETPIGALRVIEDGKSGLKTFNDLNEVMSESDIRAYHNIGDDACWDIGTLAIMPEYRGNGIPTVMMIRGAYKALLAHDIKHAIAAMDSRPYKKLVKGVFGAPYVPLAGMEPLPYLGSDSTQPLYSYVSEYKEALEDSLQKSDNDLAKLAIKAVLDGSNVDGQIHQPGNS